METLRIFSYIFLTLGFLSAIIIYVDINMGRYQSMPIMNIAWVITALYSSVIALYMYFKYARSKKTDHEHHADMDHSSHQTTSASKRPPWVDVYISSTHCGAGCGIADIISETIIYLAKITFFGAAIWASYIIDYIFALIFGFAFQYFNIKPMKPELTFLEAFWDSVKADVLSLTSFQIGMYAWLYIVLVIFHGQLNTGNPIYWFMMQIGLTIGLFTTYPVNWLLIKTGIKMPCAH